MTQRCRTLFKTLSRTPLGFGVASIDQVAALADAGPIANDPRTTAPMNRFLTNRENRLRAST
jgi:hypothetical protein